MRAQHRTLMALIRPAFGRALLTRRREGYLSGGVIFVNILFTYIFEC